MTRPIVLVGAASSIGIRPYDDGGIRRLHQAPSALRTRGVAALADRDLGDVAPPEYRDFARPAGGVRNEAEVETYSRDLARTVAEAMQGGTFAMVIGGDCSIVLGTLLGARHATASSPCIAYIDAHTDFHTPEESLTGSAASMCLGFAAGRGDNRLARLAGPHPLVRGADTVILGRRDHADGGGSDESVLRGYDVLDIPHGVVREGSPAAAASQALSRLARPGSTGFWIHVDADVIDPSVIPAVDSPEPGGLTLAELESLLTPLVRHPQALGMEVTIYDPHLDPDGASGTRLATLLQRIFRQ